MCCVWTIKLIAYSIGWRWTSVVCISLADIESEELLKAKSDRGVAEYCWTLSSCFTWYVIQNYPEINFLTYLDADLLFYSDVQPLFDEIGNASIAIIEHRFSPRLQDREVNGRFCVEWNSFRRDEEGLACLKRWREQCIEWCYYRLEDGKMGDQKYLDDWPDRYPNCHILLHPGAGIAPWNYSQYRFSDRGDNIYLNESPLIFYHFHQFQLLGRGSYDRLSNFYTAECQEPSSVYEQYERRLEDCVSDVLKVAPSFPIGTTSSRRIRLRRFVQERLPLSVKDIARKWLTYLGKMT